MKLVQDLPEVFEEFGEQRRKSFLEIKEYKEKGVPVVGMYCAYFPTELAMAIGAIPVGLCSTSEETVAAAERELPKSICPLVKSSYGFAVEDKCPFFHFSDLVIGETTCDGKKKMYELMAEFKPIFVMELPNSQSEAGLRFWRSEIVRTKEYFEEFFGVVITDEMLREAIRLGNRIRTSLKNLCGVMRLDPAPVFGMDIQKIVTGSKYRFDFASTPEVVDAVTERILEEYQEGKHLEWRPRILITGCPIGGDTLKVIGAVEDNGGVVVAVENCSGVKTLDQMIDEEDPDLCGAIARRYLATGCSIMTPNDNRIELLGRIIEEYRVDGVVEMILSGCHATGAESVYIRKFVKEEKGIPYLAIDTNYSAADTGQIVTRVTALLEMIAVGKGEGHEIDINDCYKIALEGFVGEKTLAEILEELWKVSKIPMAVVGHSGEVEAQAGDIFKDGRRRSIAGEKVVLTLEKEAGEILGISPSVQMKAKVRELLKVVEKFYKMKQASRAESSETTAVKESGKRQDYLWVLVQKPEERKGVAEDMREKFSAAGFSVIRESREALYTAFQLSAIGGEEDRKRIIRLCKQYAQEEDAYIAVGNGFSDERKQEANRELVEQILELGRKENGRKTVYLIEEHYQELAAARMVKEAEIWSIWEEELNTVKENGLYDTLYWYLLMRRNASQTAAKLGIHRNTLLHRIARLNDLIGLDEKGGMECERLFLAMQIEKCRG